MDTSPQLLPPEACAVGLCWVRGALWGQRGLLFPQGSRCFWKCWLGISSALRAGALAWAVLCGSWGGSCLPPSSCL